MRNHTVSVLETGWHISQICSRIMDYLVLRHSHRGRPKKSIKFFFRLWKRCVETTGMNEKERQTDLPSRYHSPFVMKSERSPPSSELRTRSSWNRSTGGCMPRPAARPKRPPSGTLLPPPTHKTKNKPCTFPSDSFT